METLEVNTADGVVNCNEHRPPHKQRGAVLMFADAFGLRAAIDEMAARLANAGFYVLAPNPLYRAGKIAPFDAKTVWGDEKERARLMAVIGPATNPEPAMRDVGVYLDT